jgi:hypothetical protein
MPMRVGNLKEKLIEMAKARGDQAQMKEENRKFNLEFRFYEREHPYSRCSEEELTICTVTGEETSGDLTLGHKGKLPDKFEYLCKMHMELRAVNTILDPKLREQCKKLVCELEGLMNQPQEWIPTYPQKLFDS